MDLFCTADVSLFMRNLFGGGGFARRKWNILPSTDNLESVSVGKGRATIWTWQSLAESLLVGRRAEAKVARPLPD
ncbi:hypothetical protein K0M31_012522 [Melipona bicolor]|uniref:Uncharacterized protein n=1 Tax=Melipona bicolor TaxID=60889 RepID=A0AA40FKJ0_9HYME|nr:hypothetical protein K0M31_012522 [Melipona bicolor]